MILDKFNLDGKIAIVTGCKRGIGYAMAEALAEAGADIIGVSTTLELQGSAIAKTIENVGRKFYAYQCDFSDRVALYQFIVAVKSKFKKIDILVNNAGNILRKPAAEHPDEYWDEIIAVNQTSQFILSREFGAGMIKQNSGKIIFTASLLTFQGGINVPGYTASKSAIGGIIKALSNEWAKYNININGIAPGYIATDNTSALRGDEDRNKSILERIPAGRWGDPEDFKGVAVFLASEASNYVNGSIVTVDGGWMGR